MQRFLLLLSLVFFLAWCSLPWTQKEVHTYEGDYARVVGEIIPAKWFAYLDTLSGLNTLMMPSGIDNSWIRLVFDVPQAASGDVTLIANAQRETYKKFLAEMSLTGSITWPNGKLDFNSLRGKIFANAEKARYFWFLESFDISGSAVTRDMTMAMENAKKYLWKWWVFDQMEFFKNSAGYDRKGGEEMQVIMKAYVSFLQDIQTKEWFARLSGLFSQNPFFEATASWRLDGNEYVYPVIFSRNGTEKFVTKFYEQYV